MLTKEQNELLTQVGSSTPMGELMRQYWIPFYLSNDLEADGPPQRVRLLGEDLIVFRATSGQVGLVGNHCPHRGASLFFARNEEDGLRCVYHGWKYDVSGACVDMPNEPPESNFKHKIQHTAYPVQERNGILWTYMGQSADLPELPNFEWNSVPTDQVHYSIRIADNNFMQPIEGEYDTTHIGFLHQGNQNEQADLSFIESVLRPQGKYEKGWTWNEIGRRYKAPRWETADTDYGVLVGSRRDLGERRKLLADLSLCYALPHVDSWRRAGAHVVGTCLGADGRRAYHLPLLDVPCAPPPHRERGEKPRTASQWTGGASRFKRHLPSPFR